MASTATHGYAGGGRASPAGRGSDYAELSRQIKQEGLLDRRPAYYVAKVGANIVALAAGWTAFAMLGQSWYQLLVAAFLGVVFTQLAFIGHDAGHRQIFRTRRGNDALGTLHGNLLVGLSYGWWVGKHNRHHANPNTEGKDPDIGGAAIAFTDGQARARSSAVGRIVGRLQGYLFLPMLLLEGLHLHFASVQSLLRGTAKARSRAVELSLLVVHTVAYVGALVLVLSPLQAVAFFAVHQGLFGLYMGCSFAPNHKGMPVLREQDKLDYLRRQVLTSRNVRGGRFVDFVLGGLNYQIEHHLFPSMPRPSLRRSQPLVRAYCRLHGLPYHESSILDSYRQAIGHLNDVGASLRRPVGDMA